MKNIKEIMLDILKRDGLIDSIEYEKALHIIKQKIRENKINKSA